MISRIRSGAEALFTATLAGGDAVLIGLAFYAAYYLRLQIKWPTPAEHIGTFREYWGMLAVQVFSIWGVTFFYGLYRQQRARPWVDEVTALVGSVSVGTLIAIAGTSLIFKNTLLELDYSRGMVIYAWAFTVSLVSGWHVLHRRFCAYLRGRGWSEQKVLVIGSGEIGQMIVQKLIASPELGYRVVGVIGRFENSGNIGGRIQGIPILGVVDDLPDLIARYGIAEVIIGEPDATHQELIRIISLCEQGGRVNIKIFPDLFQIMASQINIGDLNGLPLLTVHDVAMRGWKLGFKRAMDVIGSSVGLIFLSPFLLFVALLIELDSPGPVLYAQERMGLDGKLFWVIKFRSMRRDAEEEGPGWTTEGDPRRTKLGELLRRTNIDELPQLINVFLGEMSLVGPRPERPVYVEQFRRSIPRYMERHREKGGMTGWAQVNGLRGDTSISERIKYDLWYIENWSLWLDIKILLQTFFSFGSKKNAY